MVDSNRFASSYFADFFSFLRNILLAFVLIEEPTQEDKKSRHHTRCPPITRSDTMRTSVLAREEASAWLATGAFGEMELEIINSKTEEFPAGWVYYYQSALFLRTRDIEHSLVGNAPLFVPRNGASPMFISCSRSTSESADAFSCCGDANAEPRPEVELKGWVKGARKISANKAIRAYSSLGLCAAHDAVEGCLSGRAIKIQTESVVAARELVSKLKEFGFIAGIAYGG